MIRIASRASKLALAQAESVRRRLSEAWPDQRFEIIVMETRGDREIDRPLPEIGGKGLFTEALERALLSGEADLAVHSLKDLPTELPEGLEIGAVAERDDPRDAWVAREGIAGHPQEVAPDARVGTSSQRRRALLLAVRGDLRVSPVRGNIDTRLRKLDEGRFDALLMAAAGLRRLGMGRRITGCLDPPFWLPAPGQGAVAIEVRRADAAVGRLLPRVEDAVAGAATTAERAFLAALGGGCQVPVGALAVRVGGGLLLQGLVAAPDGARIVRAERRGPLEAPVDLGRRLAEDVLALGAEPILQSIRDAEARST